MYVALAFSLSGLEVLEPVHEPVEVWYLQRLASGANLSVWGLTRDIVISMPTIGVLLNCDRELNQLRAMSSSP
jgi:hypothetical protein